MLYVFHGSDTHAAITKASTLIASLRAKKADASYVRVEAGHWSPSIIEEHLGGQGLFSNKYIILLDRVTENADAKEQLPELIASMNESTNIFVMVEGKMNAELKKAVGKHAEKVVECDVPAKVGGAFASKEEFNVFALADAVGQRDSFKAWSTYRQAVDNGIESESIIGTLFWQLKSMAVAATGNSAGETGLSPFLYSKAKRAAGNYSADELRALTDKFITLYHDGHRGKVDMESGVERILLALK
jgi:DNA polymerase III delta subunit